MNKLFNIILFCSVFIFFMLFGCGVSTNDLVQDISINQQNTSYSMAVGGTHIFGDSIFATLNHRIKNLLENKSGKQIADHSESGKWALEIKNQYINSRSQKPEVVIMDGGGNDVLGNSNNCKSFNEKCKIVVKNAVQMIKDTFDMMAEDGVKYIFFLGSHYPRGWSNGYDLVVDYGYTLTEPLCRDSVVPCKLIDPREKFNTTANVLEWDGVHPNNLGTEILASMIYENLPLFTIQGAR